MSGDTGDLWHVWMLSRSGTPYSVAVNIKPDMFDCVLLTRELVRVCPHVARLSTD